jgi:hypothetical protein
MAAGQSVEQSFKQSNLFQNQHFAEMITISKLLILVLQMKRRLEE